MMPTPYRFAWWLNTRSVVGSLLIIDAPDHGLAHTDAMDRMLQPSSPGYGLLILPLH
jgi:hypothetical protein